MAEDDPESALVIRVKGRTVRPSRDDTERIRDAVAVVTEVFESLIQVAADGRTAAGLRAGGNGEAQGPAPGDLQEISQELFEALKDLSGDELDADNLELIAVDLDQRAAEARQLFETRAEQFTPRPVDEAESINVAGVLFAGLSDAAGVLKQLLGLLEEVAQQSGESRGVP